LTFKTYIITGKQQKATTMLWHHGDLIISHALS